MNFIIYFRNVVTENDEKVTATRIKLMPVVRSYGIKTEVPETIEASNINT